jgi:hypothetical protein
VLARRRGAALALRRHRALQLHGRPADGSKCAHRRRRSLRGLGPAWLPQRQSVERRGAGGGAFVSLSRGCGGRHPKRPRCECVFSRARAPAARCAPVPPPPSRSCRCRAASRGVSSGAGPPPPRVCRLLVSAAASQSDAALRGRHGRRAAARAAAGVHAGEAAAARAAACGRARRRGRRYGCFCAGSWPSSPRLWAAVARWRGRRSRRGGAGERRGGA